jgi:hypothetical protein
MAKKKQTKEAPGKMKFKRQVIAKGVTEDITGLGAGVLYEDEIEYTNTQPGPFTEKQKPILAATLVQDSAELMESLFEVKITPVEVE